MSVSMLANGDVLSFRDGALWPRVGAQVTVAAWYISFTNPGPGLSAPVISAPHVVLTPIRTGGVYGGDCLEISFPTTGGAWSTAALSLVAASKRWRCLTVSYDGSSTANDPTCALDGIPQTLTEQVTPTTTMSAGSASDLMEIGNFGALVTPMLGGVAHVAIWNRVLSAAEHAAIFESGPLAVPQGLVLYRPFDKTQPGGLLGGPVGGTIAPATMLTAAVDMGDPYKGQYIGSRLSRRVGRRTPPPRTSPRIRTLTPSSVVASSGWTPDGGASTLDEGAATLDAKYDRATDAGSVMTLALADPLVAVDTTQPVRIRVRAKHV